MRIFIAIPVPEEIKEEASRIKAELNRLGPDIKWVEYENYHITLKFLGEVTEGQLDDIKAKLLMVAQACPQFNFKTTGIGFFPNKNRPRVMWLGVKGEMNKAQFLGERVDTYLEELGFESEKRRSFHLTLGRMRSERNIDEVVSTTGDISNNLRSYDLPVKEFFLMESRLSSSGPEYFVLEKYNLEG
ncbi:MAG TPA: RNA 2',3'-cyclic phosphodiesterase [Gelria sp.]|nr:RNA 2',3'-cyclic phosphodiesterase [Gelria sp.]